MVADALAGKPVPPELVPDTQALVNAFYARAPQPSDPAQRVAFGTSGHRGTSVHGSFNEAHIRAIARAIIEYRHASEYTGPVIVGRDTHALSAPALDTVLAELSHAGVAVIIDSASRYTPTPVVSHAILRRNAHSRERLSDGIVITPSHNPPEDGGIKYNPPNGGPADTDVTSVIERRANELLQATPASPSSPRTTHVDLAGEYIADLRNVIDMDAISAAGIRIGIDPLGGASIDYWERIAEMYRLNIEIVNRTVDASFAFMCLDWDGRIRMDCSSPYAMAGLIDLRSRFDIAAGLDPDADRHGIVTPSAGLMNPNQYLAVAVSYLFANRPGWRSDAGVGKTLVSSAVIDRVAAAASRRLVEVPVGFKWFVPGLMDGSIAFAGEESAGATFVRRDGAVWTTDKDGILLCLLAAEITARTGRDPGELYRAIEEHHGQAVYRRIDAPATPAEKQVLKSLSGDSIRARELAGDAITDISTHARGNGAAIGGVKVSTSRGWFAARPSGTENVYKIYAESFAGAEHLGRIIEEAQAIVSAALRLIGK